MTNSKDNVLVAFHETHIYVRVSHRTDDEGQKFDQTDKPLIAAARAAASNTKGKIQDQRLYIIVSGNRSRVPALAAKIFNAAVLLPKYNCQLGVPEQDMPGNMVFCAADHTLRSLRRIAKAVQDRFKGTKIEVTWPYLVARYDPKKVDEIDLETAVSAKVGVALGKRNTMWDLKL